MLRTGNWISSVADFSEIRMAYNQLRLDAVLTMNEIAQCEAGPCAPASQKVWCAKTRRVAPQSFCDGVGTSPTVAKKASVAEIDRRDAGQMQNRADFGKIHMLSITSGRMPKPHAENHLRQDA